MARQYQSRLFTEPPKEARSDAHVRVAVKLWLMNAEHDARDKAVLLLVEPDHFARKVWVPRSLMADHISKRKDPGCAFWRWEFTLPLWKAEQLGVKYE